MGTQHPLPENIPHLSSPGANNSSNGNGQGATGTINGGTGGSPVKESSFLHRETSVDDQDSTPTMNGQDNISPPPAREGVPIRWQH